MEQIKLSDKEWAGLEPNTRRSLMEQLMIIDTPKYRYAIGSNSSRDTWVMMRYDRRESVGQNKWASDYRPEQVDEWR